MIISGLRNGSTFNIKSTGIKTVLLAAIVLAAFAAGLNIFLSDDNPNGPETVEPQPANVDESDETTGEENQTEAADNYYCFICHINFQEEELSLTHQLAGVGCEDCHGESREHSSDEDGLTPPEIIYSEDKIQPFCMTCHNQDDLVLTEDHEPLFTGTDEQSKACTKCHGSHLIEVRTRRWDKETRELIWDDGVRMMKNPDSEQK